jgi:hypothetical protein
VDVIAAKIGVTAAKIVETDIEKLNENVIHVQAHQQLRGAHEDTVTMVLGETKAVGVTGTVTGSVMQAVVAIEITWDVERSLGIVGGTGTGDERMPGTGGVICMTTEITVSVDTDLVMRGDTEEETVLLGVDSMQSGGQHVGLWAVITRELQDSGWL